MVWLMVLSFRKVNNMRSLAYIVASSSIIVSAFLSGCATNLISMQQAQSQGIAMPEPLRAEPVSRQQVSVTTAMTPVLIPPANSYKPKYTHKTVDDYAEQITMQLMQQARYLTAESRIGVASFVAFDNTLQRTNALGNQLAESFIKEIQAFGLPVVDFKLMQGIHVQSDGDKVFSRNSWDLKDADVDYVLSGTMHQDEKGVRVNARIIAVEKKTVVATARGFIPHFVVNAVVPEYVLVPSP